MKRGKLRKACRASKARLAEGGVNLASTRYARRAVRGPAVPAVPDEPSDRSSIG